MKKYQVVKNGKIWGQCNTKSRAEFWMKELRKSDKIAKIHIEAV